MRSGVRRGKRNGFSHVVRRGGARRCGCAISAHHGRDNTFFEFARFPFLSRKADRAPTRSDRDFARGDNFIYVLTFASARIIKNNKKAFPKIRKSEETLFIILLLLLFDFINNRFPVARNAHGDILHRAVLLFDRYNRFFGHVERRFLVADKQNAFPENFRGKFVISLFG